MALLKGLVHAAFVSAFYALICWLGGGEPTFAGIAFVIALNALVETYRSPSGAAKPLPAAPTSASVSPDHSSRAEARDGHGVR